MSSLVTGVQTCALPILALIAVGAFRPRELMSGNHIGPEEAVDVFKALGAESAIGVHLGTFQLSSEAVNEPREGLDEVLKRERLAQRRFPALDPGQSLTVPATTARTSQPELWTARPPPAPTK